MRRTIAAGSTSLVVAAGAVLIGQQPTVQDPVPTFRSAIEAVEIDVYVSDEAGNPVSGLSADDFQLFENGIEQSITTFAAVDIPVEANPLLEAGAASPDVLTNNRPPGRLFLFVLDDAQGANILHTRRMAREFIERHFGPNDVGAVALLARGLATSGYDFTSNPRLLLDAIDRFSGGNYGNPESRPFGDARPPGCDAAADQLRARYQAADLRQLTELTARMPGRHKAMLLFTSCLALDFYDLVDYNGGVLSLAMDDAHAAMTAATRSNLAIYPIDPRRLSEEADIVQAGRFRAMADATGGVALFNSNSLAPVFDRIVRDNSHYYMLGFNSAYARDDGRYVKLEVRVNRPGLVVRTRGGYVAPTRRERREQERARGRERPPVSRAAAALASPIVTDGLPMRMFAAPFKSGRGARVAVVLELDASTLDLKLVDGAYVGEVEVAYVATDANRRVYPQVRQRATVRAEPEGGAPTTLDRVRVRVISELELPRGRYQLRMAADSGARSGSIVYDLEVPDYSDAALGLGGVALSLPRERHVLTLTAEPLSGSPRAAKCYTSRCQAPAAATVGAAPGVKAVLDGRLPGPPTTRREFAAGDETLAVVEVHDNRRTARNAPPRVVELTAAAHGETGARVVLAADRVTARPGAAAGEIVDLPLRFDDLAPGAYVLRIEARAPHEDGEDVVVREIPFRVTGDD